MKQPFRVKLLVPVALAILIAGCGGGGGGGGGSTTPASSSDWDTMVWDQDNWG